MKISDATRVCKNCGKRYRKVDGTADGYCSRECKRRAEDRYYRRTCRYCGKTYDQRYSSARGDTSSYCSQSCKEAARASRSGSTTHSGGSRTTSSSGSVEISFDVMKWVVLVIVAVVALVTCADEDDTSYTGQIESVRVEQSR